MHIHSLLFAKMHLTDKVRQISIGIRTTYNLHSCFKHFTFESLSHTSQNRNSRSLTNLLNPIEHLFFSFLSNRASIQQYYISLLDIINLSIMFRKHRPDNFWIINIHLTPICLNMKSHISVEYIRFSCLLWFIHKCSKWRYLTDTPSRWVIPQVICYF